MHTLRRKGWIAPAIGAALFLALSSFLSVPSSAAIPFGREQAPAAAEKSAPKPFQETGFLNRTVELHGILYRFQVYLPEDFHKPDPEEAKLTGKKPELLPPILLFLHGRGERGSEGMWQTQIGLPQQIRDHPERWPFVVVMPQCPLRHFWTEPEMLQMAMAALDQEAREFHADPDRTYLTGLSLGGYGAWELAREYPRRWAAMAIVAGGIFWSYAPDRWRDAATLPGDYAHRIGHLPIWLFHGADDTTVLPRQSELMFDAFKAEGGHIRLWEYQGLKHDSWTRAYNEPELPRWLLEHRLNAQGLPVHDNPAKPEPQLPAFAEHLTVPLHPPALKLPTTLLDTYVGEYRDANNILAATIVRQGEQLLLKNASGEANEIQAETPATFFYPTRSLTRLTFEHDAKGQITGIQYRDDRHEELWEKKK